MEQIVNLLDSIEVTSHTGKHRIELLHGDLTTLPEEHRVDVLVVSAFPNRYYPTPNSLIGALAGIGVNVSDLASHKDADLRESFSCWISKEIRTLSPNVKFNRLLVFEPLMRGNPSDVVGDIFQSLMPFVYGNPYIKSIAMPLVATGNQGAKPEDMITPLIEAAVNWFQIGLPVEVIKIVERSEAKAKQLQIAFATLKQQIAPNEDSQAHPSGFDYDFFISYSHNDYKEVDLLCNELAKVNPDVRIYMDRQKLKVGAAWQQELYETIDDCARVITVYTPSYLNSKICREEYNIALMRHREEGNVLVPLYLQSAKLPTYMRLIQYIDCRENDLSKLEEFCHTVL